MLAANLVWRAVGGTHSGRNPDRMCFCQPLIDVLLQKQGKRPLGKQATVHLPDLVMLVYVGKVVMLVTEDQI